MSAVSTPARGGPDGAGDERTSSSRRAMPVSLLTGIASRRENLRPLYRAGLWLAVT